MFSRVQNRNTGYSENLFSHNPRMENNTLNSIDGATALKLDESYQLKEEELSNIENENLIGTSIEEEQVSNNIPSGVSIESASYIENNALEGVEDPSIAMENEKECVPRLFSDEQNHQSEESSLETENQENNESEQLFDQDINEEEDFEIPAFLRKQKF